MESKEITLKTIFDTMNSKFEDIDNRFDCIDNRLDGIDNRLDSIDDRLDGIDGRLNNMDIRISKIDGDNKEAHEKILEELHRQGDIITKLETEYNDKISILFDANEYARNRMHLFGNQQLRFSHQLEDFSYRLVNLEKAVFVNN